MDFSISHTDGWCGGEPSIDFAFYQYFEERFHPVQQQPRFQLIDKAPPNFILFHQTNAFPWTSRSIIFAGRSYSLRKVIHSALVLLYDYSKFFLARGAVTLRSGAFFGPGDVIIPAFGTVDAVHRLVWNRGCHLRAGVDYVE